MTDAPFEPVAYPYRRSPDQDAAAPPHHPVIVVGAGPVGLVAAIDLALRDVPVLVLDDNERVSHGSRAMAFAKRTLEILDRLGCAEPMLAKGVTWSVGKVFYRDALLYGFDLLPEAGHMCPAFINLQQYYLEHFLVERLQGLAAAGRPVELRGRNAVRAVAEAGDGVRVDVDTPDGPYGLTCDWLIACDGAHSGVRAAMGLDFEGRVFEDNFQITDVKMKADMPTERWFWFDPPCNPGRSALLHKQPDDVWRIDMQLGPDADREEACKPETVLPRLRTMLGPDVAFDLEWVSVYTFQCRRLERFRHGRVIFAGDSAHLVSPFGGRGANGGIQDADNLAWKLALVVRGDAPEALLDSYDAERVPAADENMRVSAGSTDFVAPKNRASRLLRNAVLDLATDLPFARAFVNSGRLSRPHSYLASPLNGPDAMPDGAGPPPGAPAPDAPVREADGRDGWLLRHLGGDFVLMRFGEPGPVPAGVRQLVVAERAGPGGADGALGDPEGLVARRYGAQPGLAYLFRPDQHVAARLLEPTAAEVAAAVARAMSLPASPDAAC